MATIEKRLIRKRLIALMSDVDAWEIVDVDHAKRADGLWIKSKRYDGRITAWQIGTGEHGIAQATLRPADDPDRAFQAAWEHLIEIERRPRPLLTLLGVEP